MWNSCLIALTVIVEQRELSTIHYGYRKCGTPARTEHLSMGATRLKQYKETEEEGKKVRRGEWMWKEVQLDVQSHFVASSHVSQAILKEALI